MRKWFCGCFSGQERRDAVRIRAREGKGRKKVAISQVMVADHAISIRTFLSAVCVCVRVCAGLEIEVVFMGWDDADVRFHRLLSTHLPLKGDPVLLFFGRLLSSFSLSPSLPLDRNDFAGQRI